MSTVEDIEAVLCEFIEAIIHEVLHLRAIYPAELFTRQRLYNIAVRKSRHPKLNDYIHGVVQSIKVRSPRPWWRIVGAWSSWLLVDRSCGVNIAMCSISEPACTPTSGDEASCRVSTSETVQIRCAWSEVPTWCWLAVPGAPRARRHREGCRAHPGQLWLRGRALCDQHEGEASA